jgi:hypothetical protein
MSESAAAAPAMKLAFRLELRFDRPLEFPTMAGERGFFRIVESRLEGERIRGAVADDGGDWIVFRPDGVVETDSRMMIRTEDGVLVYLRSRGVIRAKPEQLALFKQGRGLEAGEAYFRTAPYFDTPVGPYDWLTKALFVGSGRFYGDRSVLDIHEVL